MEDRRTPRRPCRLAVRTADGRIGGRATEMSDRGLYLQCWGDDPLSVGQRLTLEIVLPDGPLNTMAEVIATQDEVFYRAGSIRFIGLGETAAERINHFVRARPPRKRRGVALAQIELNERSFAEA